MVSGWMARAARVAVAAVVGLLGVGIGASPASAHAALVSSSPAADALLQEAPTQVVLTFTEGVNPVADKVRVIAPNGRRVDRGEARASGAQLIVPLDTISQVGTYLVTFRVISADSHPVGGAFAFSYKQVSPGGPPSAEGAVGSSGFVLAALPVARWTGYVGLVLLVGATLVLALLWPRRLDRAQPLRVAYLGAAMVALGTIAELALQVPYVAGAFGDVTGEDVREVLSSQYGAAHLVRLGVLAAALVLLRDLGKGQDSGTDRILLAVAGAVGIATWSLSGHPRASTVPAVSVGADMVHLASMAVWLGGLIMLVLFLLRRANAAELGAIVPIWSRWAGYAIGALLLTGVAQSLLEVGTIDALITTTYGALLLAKIGLVAVVLLVASFSRRSVAAFAPAGPAAEAGEIAPPIPDPDEPDAAEPAPPAAGRLRRLVLAEAAVALVVIGVASVLVQLTPARTDASTDGGAPGVQTVVLSDPAGRFKLTADLSPALVGINELHLYATDDDGRPITVVEWTIAASNSAAGIERVDAVVQRITDDHAIGQVTLPEAGTWRVTFTLRLDETTNGIVFADFNVRSR